MTCERGGEGGDRWGKMRAAPEGPVGALPGGFDAHPGRRGGVLRRAEGRGQGRQGRWDGDGGRSSGEAVKQENRPEAVEMTRSTALRWIRRVMVYSVHSAAAYEWGFPRRLLPRERPATVRLANPSPRCFRAG